MPAPQTETEEPRGETASASGGLPVPVAPAPAEPRLRTIAPPQVAGGLGAITSSARFGLGRMGAVRTARTLARVNQHGGFDCPGCAWPDPETPSWAEFCENGVKAVSDEATRRRIDRAFFARHSIADLLAQSDHWLNAQGRLTEPMVLREGATHYAPIGWDEAFALVAAHLGALPTPDRAIFYTSGRTSNEAAFLYQLFVRRFGTNNLPDCSNMCHESSGAALHASVGVGKGTVLLSDFEQADIILVVGQNPGTNHPRMLSTLQEAARRGAHIVSVNPLPEAALVRFKHPQEVWRLAGAGTAIAAEHLAVRVGGDLALFSGLAKALIDRGAVDHAFIEAHTEGYAALAEHLGALPWDAVEAVCGLARARIEALADRLAGTPRIIACWAMGLTQQPHAVATIQSVVNALLLRGAIGRPGAGVCPVRGHSNVQGDRTMGICEKPSEAFLSRLGARFGFSPPREHGLDTVDSIRAMRDGRADVFFAMGGNFLSAAPDTEATAEALRRCALTAQVSTKLNRSHLVHGRQALILPCLGRTERDVQAGGEMFVTVENSMGVVHTSQGRLPPASEALRSEPAIVAGLAEAVFGAADAVPWAALAQHYDRIRDAIEAVVPGFDDFHRRVRRPGGFALPNPARDERRWQTPSGKAHLFAHPLPDLEVAPDQLVLMTLRSHDQYNTTIYGLDDRYRGVRGGRRVVFLSATDLQARGLRDGDAIDVASHHRGQIRWARRFVAVEYPIVAGCAAAYFPEANPLVPLDHVAAGSNTPASKWIPITVHPAAPREPQGAS